MASRQLLNKPFTYLEETFTYYYNHSIESADCEDFDYHPNEKVIILDVRFSDGLKFQLCSKLITVEDDVPVFELPDVIVRPTTRQLNDTQCEIVKHLTKKHNLPCLPFS